MENTEFIENNTELPSSEEKSNNLKKPGIFQVGVLYSIAVILLLYVGSRVQDWNFNIGILITEFVLVLVPPLVFLFIYKFDVKRILRLNKIKISNLFLIFWIMVFAMPITLILNLVNLYVIRSVFGRVVVSEVPIGTDTIGLFTGIFVIGVSAGICEEVLFRGVIMRGFERFGAVKAILITAILFGLMHIDFQKFMGTFLLGGLIGFLVYRSNSIFAGIFAHFANNTISVIMTYYALKMSEKGMVDIGADKTGDVFAQLESLPQVQLIAVAVVWGIMFVFSAVCFSFLIYAFIRNTSKHSEEMPQEEKSFSVKSLIGLLPGVLLIAFMYVMRGLELKNVLDPETIRNIYSAMRLM